MLVRTRPRLRFIDPPAEPAPAGGAPVVPPVTPPAEPVVPATGVTPPAAPVDNGFPANTAVADMTAEQQAAYWKHYARRHESDAAAQRTRAEQLEQANRTDEQKREDALREEGRLSAGLPFVQDAVTARLALATGKTEEEVATLLEYVDVNKFVVDGRIDQTKVAAYAASVGTAAPVVPDPVVPPTSTIAAAAAAMAGRQTPGAQRTGSSINDARKAVREKFAPKAG